MCNNKEYICTICINNINDIDDMYVLPCNHYFHYDCLFKFYDIQINIFGIGTCPICRKEYEYVDGYSYLEIYDTIISRYNTYNKLFPRIRYCDKFIINLQETIYKNMINELNKKFPLAELIIYPDYSFSFKYMSINMNINWFYNTSTQ